jgi:hypothetical protein
MEYLCHRCNPAERAIRARKRGPDCSGPLLGTALRLTTEEALPREPVLQGHDREHEDAGEDSGEGVRAQGETAEKEERGDRDERGGKGGGLVHGVAFVVRPPLGWTSLYYDLSADH